MSKTINLGPVTAYADAVAAGYTGTREQFAQDLANAANYAAESHANAEAASDAAETATAAASAASLDADAAHDDAATAHSDAEAALSFKTAAETAATTATTKAGEAANSASQAATSASGAAGSATAASGSATAAAGSATNAAASETAAAGSATAAAGSASAAAQTLVDVNAAGATQIAAIGAKGEEVLESIPSDYTTLSNDVDELKSDLDDLESGLFIISDNLFDFDNKIANKVPDSVGSSYDSMVDLNGWYTSNYIPVTAGEQYALILNNAITQGAIFRVACYANGVMTYKTAGSTEPNPFTIPSGVDHIRFYSNTANLFNNRTNTSFKKYSADMSLAWMPYGASPKFASKEAVAEFGVYVDGTNYYHFVRFGEKTLIRLFKQEGPNNLFQFSALYTGEVSEYGVSINETIATNGTDTVGPISIMRQGVDSGGMWSGGWHTRTVNGVTCPTAEQISLDIKINGENIVGVDGLHYGECVATAVNNLYFPQTITGTDLSTATKAIEETVTYIFNDKMTARVVHKYLADTRVILYYGMQAVRIGFNKILLPNNETSFAFADMTANINLEKSEDLMQMSNDDWNYDLIMKPFGLAKYTHNSGAGSTKYGYLPTATRKVYWALMEGAYDYTFITNGKVLTWEGVWDIYPN